MELALLIWPGRVELAVPLALLEMECCYVLCQGESGFGASLGAAVCVGLTGCSFLSIFSKYGGRRLQQAARVFRGETCCVLSE